MFKPTVMVCVPAGVANVESRAVLDATIRAGAKEAHLIAEPLAAAIGANIRITMDWSDIYLRLARDLNDSQAWTAPEYIIRGWASAALRQHGRAVVEDAVADTCATIALNFDRAHGPQTFGGFALGVFYNARRRALRPVRTWSVSVDDIEIASTVDETEDADEIDALRGAMASLPDREQHALRLRYFADASAADIAAE